MKEDAGKWAGREVVVSFPYFHPSVLHRSLLPQISPAPPVALGIFSTPDLFSHSPPGKWKHPRATRKEVWGAGRGLFKDTIKNKRAVV